MPADPISQVESFAQRGLAWALPKMARSVIIAAVKYYGVRTELTVEGGEVQYGGKKAKRAFSILIPRTQLAVDPIEGAKVTDDLGKIFTLIEVKSDAVNVILICGGAWG